MKNNPFHKKASGNETDLNITPLFKFDGGVDTGSFGQCEVFPIGALRCIRTTKSCCFLFCGAKDGYTLPFASDESGAYFIASR